MLGKKSWVILSSSILAVLFLAEAVMFVQIVRLNMLPLKFVIGILCVLLVILGAVWVLFIAGINVRKPYKARRVRRIIGAVISLIVILASIFVDLFTDKVIRTIANVTDDNVTVSTKYGVYVLADDPAKDIKDAKKYTFAIMDSYDKENTQVAVTKLGEAIGTTVTPKKYVSVVELANGLYKKEVKAIIMNESFVDIIKDTQGFKDFESKTKLIYEISVETKTKKSDKSKSKTKVTSEPFVVYISGSDTREETLTMEKSRSDSNIIMVVNPNTKQILMINTPRDFYVPNPACGGALDKLTHCGLYGMEDSIEALEQLYEVKAEFYLQINFVGFSKLVDILGGITVYSPQAFDSSLSDYSYCEGDNYLNGDQAIFFARERYSFATGDRERGNNQMRLIQALIKKLTEDSSSVLANYSDILDALSGMFLTNFTADQISSLVKMQLGDNAKWDIRTYSVTGSDGSDFTASAPGEMAYVMYPDYSTVQKAIELIDMIMDGKVITDDILEAPPTTSGKGREPEYHNHNNNDFLELTEEYTETTDTSEETEETTEATEEDTTEEVTTEEVTSEEITEEETTSEEVPSETSEDSETHEPTEPENSEE